MPYVNIRPIPGWEGYYSVTNDGRVWTEPRTRRSCYNAIATVKGRWLKPYLRGPKRLQYLSVDLGRHPTFKSYKVHRLVALAFLPNPLALPQINHIDGNPHNNHVSNLQWCTPSHNMRHTYRHGLSEARKRAIATNIRKALAATAQRGRSPAQKALAFNNGRRWTLKYAAVRMQKRADELARQSSRHPAGAGRESETRTRPPL